jgi:hypothetical protein
MPFTTLFEVLEVGTETSPNQLGRAEEVTAVVTSTSATHGIVRSEQ